MLGQASTAALFSSALCHLGFYEASARLWGPSRRRAVRVLQHWGRRACAWLRVDVRVHGRPFAEPCVYMCNHRSYLDVPLLAGVLGATFMSRADVASWPVVGAAARAAGVVFVERGDLHRRARAARAVARRTDAVSVVVFPEGTTCGERLPAAFHPGLFRLLHRPGSVHVVPVTIRYSDRRAYWVDECTLRQHVRTRVLHGPRLKADVHIGAALAAGAYADPTAFVNAVYAAVSRPIEECGELVSAEPEVRRGGRRNGR